MEKLIILLTFAVNIFLLVKAQDNSVGSVTCHYNHTVDITIINVERLNDWNVSQWRLEGKPECEPTFQDMAKTVTYTGLVLPDCAFDSEQHPESIKYILRINAITPNPGGTGQLRLYDQLYFVSCDYDNQNRSTASFVPLTSRGVNDSSSGVFTFSLQAFTSPDHTGVVPNPVALGKILYFKATVVTQSSASNLDLFIERCWSSKSADAMHMVDDDNFNLIIQGCGNSTVSEDSGDTLTYNCTNDDIKETFSIETFRFFGAAEGAAVYFHCDFRVCLQSASPTACDCPPSSECDTNKRKRRSIVVDESKLYHVTSGPFIFESNEGKEEVVNEEKDEPDEKDAGAQSISVSLVAIGSVSGVVAIAILCATIYLVLRKRDKQQHHGGLNVAT